MRSSGLAAVAVVFAFVLAAFAAPAHADQASDLFREGRALIAAGKIDEACQKFEASYKLEAAIGTKLNLADCLEKKGLLAAAHRLFDEVAVQARAKKEGREQYARQRADALLAKLVKITLVIAEPVAPGMTIAVGGLILDKDDWKKPRVLEPGAIPVEVAAPERTAWKRVIEGRAGQVVTVEVPVLVTPEANRSNATPGAGGETSGPSDGTPLVGTGGGAVDRPARPGRRRLGLVLGGVGAGLLVGSLTLGLVARSVYRDAACGPEHGVGEGECTDEGQDQTDRARLYADLGTATAIAGVAALTVGTILFVRSRGRDRVVVAPAATEGGAIVVIRGSM